MVWVVALLSIAFFIVAFLKLNIVTEAAKSIIISRGACRAIFDKELDERQRERAMQHASISLLRVLASLILRSVLALIVSLIPVMTADVAGIVPSEDVGSHLMRFDVMAIAAVIIMVSYILCRRIRRSK